MATNAPSALTEKEILNAECGDTFADDPGAHPNTLHHRSLSHTGSAEHEHDGHFAVPSPTPTRRNRTLSASERGAASPLNHGKIKTFCREKGHGFIVPNSGGGDVFVHVSDVDGETVPKPGDEVIYKTILMPPKMERVQAIHVQIIAMKPGVKHDHWVDTSELKE